MKHALPIIFVLAFGLNAQAQNKGEITIPEPVRVAFAKQFPKAESAKWEAEDKDFEAEFKMSGVKYSAVYAASGKWMETEHKIKPEALPEAVRKMIAANYADHKMEGAELVERPDGTFYEVDLEKGEQELEVLFSADGKVLKSKVEKEDKNEKDEKDED